MLYVMGIDEAGRGPLAGKYIYVQIFFHVVYTRHLISNTAIIELLVQ